MQRRFHDPGRQGAAPRTGDPAKGSDPRLPPDSSVLSGGADDAASLAELYRRPLSVRQRHLGLLELGRERGQW